ncbi:MAG: hypothetical protein GY863_20520 [bacterium]|nr:hypothetical protein [bacterium]
MRITSYLGLALILIIGGSFVFYYVPPYSQNSPVNSTMGFLSAIFVISSLKLIKKGIIDHFRLQEMEKKHVESELSVLKAQINPHFLLNTFNSLYSLSLKNSPEIPEIILKYSDMMKYILTKVSSDRVELNEELDFINNYISIQKMRFSDKCTITLNVEGKTEGELIAPMVLFPFVENSFKHGIGTSNSDSFINIRLIMDNNNLKLVVENSIPDNLINSEEDSLKTGLINVKKRLEYIYDSNYDLIISDTQDTYNVKLAIEL